jgi:radical SAM protein
MLPAPHPHAHGHGGGKRDYSRNPINVYWETTQACALACRHCRAEAVPDPLPTELTRSEGKDLIYQISKFNHPHPQLILTGGDPLRRPDIFELIDEARQRGITVSITPSVTPALTLETLTKLKQHGIEALGISLDGSSAERHEAVRGVAGCFDWTMAALRNGASLGFPIQVNTLVSQETLDDLPRIYELLKTHTIMRWSLFFLISVGRGQTLQPISPEQAETCMQWVFDLSQQSPFAIGTTEAPSYRRVALQRMQAEGRHTSEIQKTPVYRGFGIRDGHGIVFISSEGYIYPAGFLPLIAGNVRRNNLVDVYRNSSIFQSLHSPSTFKGKCGHCEFSTLCGGSRARAYAATGDPLASDPLCLYEPVSPLKSISAA